MKKSGLGFTLIEIVVTILIISVLAVAAYTQLSSVALNAGSLAQQVANDVRYTQALSMYTGQRYYLMGLSSTSYEIANGSGTPVTMATGGSVFNFPAGLAFGSSVNLPNGIIGFTGRGIPITDTSGTLLNSTAQILIVGGSTTMTISVSPVTGRVIVQ
jgi:prepilin-type N-terminal cleavage/methylation domain-containing protein